MSVAAVAAGAARRVLPHNQEAEESVVGGVLFNGRVLPQIADLLEPDDFYHSALQVIYEVMVELDRESQPIDIITVAEHLRKPVDGTVRMNKLRAYNGEAYLAELANKIATVENITYHARIVRDHALRRKLLFIGAAIVERGFTEHPAEAQIEAGMQALIDLSLAVREETTEPLSQVLRRTTARLEDRYNRKEAISGVPSDYVGLDALTGGLQPGHLIVVAARPAMGKTSFVMNLACNAAINHGVPALVFTLEMASEELVERALGAEGRVLSERIRSGYLETRDWINLTKAGSRLTEAPIDLDADSYTLREIRARARRWRANPKRFPPGGPSKGLIVVDYLQLIEGSSKGRGTNREQEIAEVSRGLKRLAKKLQVPIVALSQLNRGVEARANKRPMCSDLRESGAIEQDADLIAFIYRDEVYDPETTDQGVAEIILGKHRSGPTGTVRLTFLKQYTRFENLTNRQEGS